MHGALTPEEIRRLISVDWIEHTARYVAMGRCQCCGDAGDPMACGHRRCEHCAERRHECIACALAV